MYALVALTGARDASFSYKIPAELADGCHPGYLVLVPVGNSLRTGVVWACSATPQWCEGELKEIEEVLSDESLLDDELRQLLNWMIRYYHQPAGAVITAALPGHLRYDRKQRIRWNPAADPTTLAQQPAALQAIATALQKRSNGLTEETLARNHGRRGLSRRLKQLEMAGYILTEQSWNARHTATEAAESPTSRVMQAAPPLNEQQQQAVGQLVAALEAQHFAAFLLDGVTGSGKTEVYFRGVEHCLAQGRQALLLVPEIALTPQLIQRYEARFHENLAVFHSEMSAARRYRDWQRAKSGAARVVIGARSALFAPFAKLGLIVVDEEHEGSYKQEEGVPYNARDMAVVRARMNQAVLVLGSATPSMESLYNAQQGRYHHLHLTQRATGVALPPVQVINLADKKNLQGLPFGTLLSHPLRQAMQQVWQAGKQSLLFLNRRGFAPAILCNLCGITVSCPNCSVALTLHKGAAKLVCHYCDHVQGVPDLCPNCKQLGLIQFGPGTERLQLEVESCFPEARVARLDRDAVAQSGAMERILKQFHEGQIDILVGTQMVAKGHHFPRLTLVGVVLAETTLSMPDFRAAERTFQLITQVAGRAGREAEVGQVYVQSFDPAHYAIQAAMAHDADRFADAEFGFRQLVGYPPFKRMAVLRFSTPNVQEGGHFIHELRRLVPDQPGVVVLGPAPAPLFKLRNRFRWQLMIKAETVQGVHAMVSQLLQIAQPMAGRKIRVDVDIDPYGFV
ncbi:replication restart DNA helicase PriA [Magnetococcus marinus MC-1]|uniref:Replication restart protein PriA n=1 Tax=Magnetococcus marinus (strain ATCC BAA-1437 / JCM 17883 / MC-1) TaxID=156889 RepID=A0LE29_MAGMM|nr:primosomal protein N' [Magnetococcus marinus]ABK46222.1 replication restart DNA helicase PriA [Magnetococcus marinus MC-1]